MIKKINNINNLRLLLIVVGLLAFSIGVWSNFRQLWLESNNFQVTSISRVFSVGMICSSIMAIVIMFFSTQVKTKSVLSMTLFIRTIALFSLIILNDTSDFNIIKIFMLLSIITETIYLIGIYPLITNLGRSNSTYKKYALVNFIASDSAVIICGFIVGKTISSIVLDYNTCLILALIANVMGLLLLAIYKEKTADENEEPINKILSSIKKVFQMKIQKIYFIYTIFVNISYDILFGLMFIILTKYLGLKLSVSSSFIIITSVIASLIASILLKRKKEVSPKNSIIIKFGVRLIFFLIAVIYTNKTTALIAIAVTALTSRMFDDRVNGIYINLIDSKYQFLYSNINYFMAKIGEAIGMLLAGILLSYGLKYTFLGVFISTLIQVIIGIYLSKVYSSK